MGRGGGGGGHSGGGFSGGSRGGGFSSGGSRGSSGFSGSRSSSSFGGGSRSSGSSRGFSSGGSSRGSHRGGSSGSFGSFGFGNSNNDSYGKTHNGPYYTPGPRPGYFSTRPVIINSGPRYYGGFHQPVVSPGGCLTRFLLISLILFIVMVLVVSCAATMTAPYDSGGSHSGSPSSITSSTYEREPLKDAVTVDAGWYTDELGWIDRPSVLTGGMREFYKATGVMPYLYITDELDGDKDPSDSEAQEFCQRLYDKLFTAKNGTVDGAHVLVVFFEPYESEYSWYIQTGYQAYSVIDDEARAIMGDYIDSYYTDSSLDDSQYFAKIFEKSAERIMSVTKPMWYAPALLFGATALLLVIFLVWRRAKDKKIEEAKATAEILNTPLQTYTQTETTQNAEDLAGKYGSGSAEDLANKYK